MHMHTHMHEHHARAHAQPFASDTQSQQTLLHIAELIITLEIIPIFSPAK